MDAFVFVFVVIFDKKVFIFLEKVLDFLLYYVIII